MMGCGKSTIGKMLSDKLNFDLIDCDTYLEDKYNKTVKECFDISEEYFRGLETICCEEISKFNKKIISTGGGVIKNKKNIKFFKNDIIIFINRPIEDTLADINCECRPLISDKNAEKIKNIYNSRVDIYKKYCTYEVSNDKNIDLVVDEIIDILKNAVKL